jgi:hypothetical protein
LEEGVGAEDVGVNEGAGAVDGAIHMGFGCEVHHGLRLEIRESGLHGDSIADIGLQEPVTRRLIKITERCRIPGVGELVDVENLMTAGHQKTDEIGTDEAGTASDENFHEGDAGKKVVIVD